MIASRCLTAAHFLNRRRTIARNSSPETYEKRRRERDKQLKKAAKAEQRRERNAFKKAVKDGLIEPPNGGMHETIDPAALQPEAYGYRT